MRTYTTTHTVYNYNELGTEARAHARSKFLDDNSWMLCNMLEEDILSALSAELPESDLKVQFSLSSCQGDGMNVYGTLNYNDALSAVKDALSAKDHKFLEWAVRAAQTETKMPYNNHYCYCLATHTDFSASLMDALEDEEFNEWQLDAFDHFNYALQKYFTTFCREWEKLGYRYLYEIEDDAMESMADANGWEFYEDGTLA